MYTFIIQADDYLRMAAHGIKSTEVWDLKLAAFHLQRGIVSLLKILSVYQDTDSIALLADNLHHQLLSSVSEDVLNYIIQRAELLDIWGLETSYSSEFQIVPSQLQNMLSVARKLYHEIVNIEL